MRIPTPADPGALIRERRKALRLDQQTLAEKVGVSRQWIVDAEQGKPTKGTSLAQSVILDSIVDAARKRRK